MSFLTGFLPFSLDGQTRAIIGTTVVTTIALFSLARWALDPKRRSVIHGPLKTAVPFMSEKEMEICTYKPDAFPGGRDVATPVSFFFVG